MESAPARRRTVRRLLSLVRGSSRSCSANSAAEHGTIVCRPVTKRASPLAMERTKNIAQTTAPPTAARIVSLDDRVAVGKALREKISREQHGRWNEVRGTPNPIELLHKSDAGRLKTLIPIRYGRML